MDITSDTVISRTAEILHSELDEEVVLLDAVGGAYYGTNAVGARVWSLVEEPVSVGAVVETLVAEYDVEVDTCRSAVMAFVETMLGHGVLVASPRPT